MTESLAIPIYFTCIGFGIFFFAETDVTLVLLFLIWSSGLKIGSVWLAVFLVSRSAVVALDYAVAMNTRGGPGLVLAAAAYSTGLIEINTFLALIAASIVTAYISEAYLLRASTRIASG